MRLERLLPQLALTNFHSVTFTRSFAVGNSLNGTISSPNWTSTELQLVPRSHRFYGDPNDPSSLAGGAGAMPSALVPDGSGFSVAWSANPTATSACESGRLPRSWRASIRAGPLL